MVRIDIPFIVDGQHIKQWPKVKIAAGGQNYFYAVFKIHGVWTNISYKKAVFRYDNHSYIMDIVQNGDQMECEIPWEVMTTPNTYFDTGIFGGDRLPTSMARTFVIEGCICDGQEPQAPTPDWFKKIEDDITDIKSQSSDMKQLETLIDLDMLPATHDLNGKILTDESGRIILRY